MIFFVPRGWVIFLLSMGQCWTIAIAICLGHSHLEPLGVIYSHLRDFFVPKRCVIFVCPKRLRDFFCPERLPNFLLSREVAEFFCRPKRLHEPFLSREVA